MNDWDNFSPSDRPRPSWRPDYLTIGVVVGVVCLALLIAVS